MEKMVVPEFLISKENKKRVNKDLFLYDYNARFESLKNKVVFTKNTFIFMISGKKIIDTIHKTHIIKDNQCVLIKKGNCLTSEKFSTNGVFKLLTLFFDTKILMEFCLKHDVLVNQKKIKNKPDQSIFIFEKDNFILNYIDSAKHILQIKNLSNELVQLKFEEIMLYLIQKYGTHFLDFIYGFLSDSKESNFRCTIESESLNKYSLDEIAFLCNMSLSTFKRHFSKSFGVSPQKWFQQKRMQYAYESIKNNYKTPSDLYIELGYNSLSSFSVAFSKIYGTPPTKI